MNEWEPNPDDLGPKAGEPPLHRAARLGDADAIRRLVAEGTEIDAPFDMRLDPDGRPAIATPLMVAAGSGDGATVETVRLLLSLGADPKIEWEGRTAFSYAASGLGWNYRPSGDSETLRVLVDAGGTPPSDPEEANRMLCRVAESGDPDLLRQVVRLVPNVNGHWDKDEAEAWHRRLNASMASNVREKMEEAGVEYDDAMMSGLDLEMFESSTSAPYSSQIPLFCAAESGSADCVRLLVAFGADPKKRDNSSRSALWYAGSAEVVHLLVELGLSLEDVDRYGWTPLTDAAGDGLDSIDRARWLIEAGADVNAIHDRGYTVFMTAASGIGRHVDTLRLLVASGADPYAVSELGYNAFHAAVDVNGEANEEASVRSVLGYLYELGVSLTQRNHRGWTPLEKAQYVGTDLEVGVLSELMERKR